MTFSIVARDPETGAFGVASATGGPNVGNLVPYARAGSGAIATQGYTTNPFYGLAGLEHLATGKSAKMLCDELTAADLGRQRRQCVIIDQNGTTAAWTGGEINPWCGSLLEQDVAAAGNLLAGPEVLDDMMATYQSGSSQPFARRLLAALTAGFDAGGDKRGTKSAVLKVYSTESYPDVDVRVDWSTNPMPEMAGVLDAIDEEEFQKFLERLPTKAHPSRC